MEKINGQKTVLDEKMEDLGVRYDDALNFLKEQEERELEEVRLVKERELKEKV